VSEGGLIKDGVKKALCHRQKAGAELVDAIENYRKIAAHTPCPIFTAEANRVVLDLLNERSVKMG
jgi:hypothetical protein